MFDAYKIGGDFDMETLQQHLKLAKEIEKKVSGVVSRSTHTFYMEAKRVFIISSSRAYDFII